MVVCRSSLRNMYWSLVQQLVHHSVTGCPVRAGDLLASSFGSTLELSWGGTQNMGLEDSVRGRFLEGGNAVTTEGWCNGGACLARVLPAVPFPYETPGLGWRRSNHRRRRTPNSDSSMLDQHPRGHGGCASPYPRRAYPTTSITHPSLEDGGQIEVLLEKPTTNTPIQQRTPALEFVDGGNDVVTMSFTYLDPTRYSISLSLHSLIVAVGCSHRIQWHEPEQGNCQGDRLCCLERRRNVVNLDELRLGQTVEPRGIPGTVHRGGWAIRNRNAWAQYRRRLPDTPLTQRAGMHDRFQLAPHICGH